MDCARSAAGDRTALSQRAQGFDDYGSCESLRWSPEYSDSDCGAANDRDLQEGRCGSPGGMAALAVKTSYPLLSSSELEQVSRLMKVARTPVVEIESASMNLSLRRHSPDARLHERQCLD